MYTSTEKLRTRASCGVFIDNCRLKERKKKIAFRETKTRLRCGDRKNKELSATEKANRRRKTKENVYRKVLGDCGEKGVKINTRSVSSVRSDENTFNRCCHYVINVISIVLPGLPFLNVIVVSVKMNYLGTINRILGQNKSCVGMDVRTKPEHVYNSRT